MNTTQQWSEEQKRLLYEYYPHISNIEISKMIGRTVDAVRSYARKRGLRKSPERVREFIRELHSSDVIAKSIRTRKERAAADYRRWKNDIPQKTRLHFSNQSTRKIKYRYFLRSHGYIETGEKNIAYYDNNTHRSARIERTAINKYNIRIYPR